MGKYGKDEQVNNFPMIVNCMEFRVKESLPFDFFMSPQLCSHTFHVDGYRYKVTILIVPIYIVLVKGFLTFNVI